MGTEFERSFLNWSCEDVCSWLSGLALAKDYSLQFRADFITGSTLINLDREALEDMEITDDADRLKILQQITSMRADTVTSGPPRRVRSPIKNRQFNSTAVPSHYSGPGGGRGAKLSQKQSRYVNVSITAGSPGNADSGASVINSPSASSASQESSRISTPDNQLQDIVLAEATRGLDQFNKLQRVATLRYHNVKRLSRSLEYLFPDGEDIFSVYHRTAHIEDRGDYSTSSRLVEILREENTSLKQELETYYQRVRKLQKIEQEVEGIRDAHRMLETSTVRREGLEKALRVKLEQEIWRLKEEGIRFKAELSVTRSQAASDTPSEKNGSRKRELRRRDTMIMRLIKQNQEAAIAREQLEKDLHSTKVQLRESTPAGDTGASSESNPRPNYELDQHDKTAILYSGSIDKLKAVLSAMHNMSQKREKLEKRLREKLEGEIKHLKEDREKEGGTVEGGAPDRLTELMLLNTVLEADVVKWEHKCLELVAEKQMTFEAAIIPKEARISALERSLAEKIDTSHELRNQKAAYISKLTEANRNITELEIKLTSVQSSLQEKDSVIQMMQKSFLEPEDEPFIHTLSQLPPLSSHPPRHPYHRDLPPPLPPPHHPPLPPKAYYLATETPVAWDVGGEPLSRDRAASAGYIDMVPYSPPAQSSRHYSVGTSAQPSPRSSIVPVRTVPLAPASNAATQQGNNYWRDYPSPVKPVSLDGVGVKPKSANVSNHQTLPQDSGARRNGYAHSHTHNHTPPTNRYFPPNTIHYTSSSAPNSPNIKTAHKPRISHPNMRLLQVPGPHEYSTTTGGGGPGGYRQNHIPNSIRRKSNTGPGGLRRHNYKPLPSPRAVKSKTPPPDYRLVTVSSGGRNNSCKHEPPKMVAKKQRHRSVEDMLSTDWESRQKDTLHHQDSQELFQSLIGDSNMVPSRHANNNNGGLVSSMQGAGGVAGGRACREFYGGHQHSKSSPPNNSINQK